MFMAQYRRRIRYTLSVVNFQLTFPDLYKRKWLHRTIVPIAPKTKIKCRRSGKKKERVENIIDCNRL